MKMKNETEIQSSESSSQPAQQSFVVAPDVPCILDSESGIRYDFNYGFRVLLPEGGSYRVCFYDLDSGLVMYAMDVEGGKCVASARKYWSPIHFDIFKDGKTVLSHTFDCKGRHVLLNFPEGALGDSIAWFSYAERFQKKTGCILHLCMMQSVAELFKAQYPDIGFVSKEDALKLNPYATFHAGLFFQGDTAHQPFDFRKTGLHHTAGYIFGLDDQIGDLPPRLSFSGKRTIREKYVCIASKATSQCKMWNNPQGWRETIAWLKEKGYRVLCIDRDRETGYGLCQNAMPYGAEDFCGPLPLQERADLIHHADAFIGLSSGLSWLAWCCLPPERIFLISGFTDPVNEFACSRIINLRHCHGCWNDTRREFDHKDYTWCPVFEDPCSKFECTKSITSHMVIQKLSDVLEGN